MYKFKDGEVYECVKSIDGDIFKVGNYYPVCKNYLGDNCIFSNKDSSFTDTFLNRQDYKWFQFKKVEKVKRDEVSTIEVDKLLSMIVLNGYTTSEVKAYLKGYKEGKK